jgi:hypothetical protein
MGVEGKLRRHSAEQHPANLPGALAADDHRRVLAVGNSGQRRDRVVDLHDGGDLDARRGDRGHLPPHPAFHLVDTLLFAVGLIAAGMIAVPVLAASAAYPLAELSAGTRGSTSVWALWRRELPPRAR